MQGQNVQRTQEGFGGMGEMEEGAKFVIELGLGFVVHFSDIY